MNYKNFTVTFGNITVPVRWWTGNTPPIKGRLIAVDTETELIEDEATTPPLVLIQAYNGDYVELVHHPYAEMWLREFLSTNKDTDFVFHNGVFDTRVMGRESFYTAYNERRILDTGLRWQLFKLRTVGMFPDDTFPSLGTVTQEITGVVLKKEDTTRTTFRQDTDPTPEQLEYAAIDPIATYTVATTLDEEQTERDQTKGHAFLDTVSKNGIYVDTVKWPAQKKLIKEEMHKSAETVASYGLYLGDQAELPPPKQWAALMQRLFGKGAKHKIPGKNEATGLLMSALKSFEEDRTKSLLEHLKYYILNGGLPLNWKESFEQLMLLITPEGVTPSQVKGMKPVSYSFLLMETIRHALDNENADVDSTVEHLKQQAETNNLWLQYEKPEGTNGVLQRLLEGVEIELGINMPRTAKGDIAVSEEAIASITASIPFLDAYKEYKEWEKRLSTFMKDEFISPKTGRIHARFYPLKKTGRSSCRAPNLQQIPKFPGMREIYCAPPGKVLLSIDYTQLELCTLAQTCYTRFGFSKLRDVINADVDVHAWLACIIEKTLRGDEPWEVAREVAKELKNSKDPERKKLRQMSKAANFGYPGGLGAKTFIPYAKGYGVDISYSEAQDLKSLWKETFPEMDLHLQPEPCGGGMYVASTLAGLIRTNCVYCAAANLPFQGLAASGAKEAGWQLVVAGYEVINFIHDEFLVYLNDDEHVTEEVENIRQIIVKTMKTYVPDVLIKAEPALMYNWSKAAEAVYENGILVPWDRENKK